MGVLMLKRGATYEVMIPALGELPMMVTVVHMNHSRKTVSLNSNTDYLGVYLIRDITWMRHVSMEVSK
jgi:hypothetical protein